MSASENNIYEHADVAIVENYALAPEVEALPAQWLQNGAVAVSTDAKLDAKFYDVFIPCPPGSPICWTDSGSHIVVRNDGVVVIDGKEYPEIKMPLRINLEWSHRGDK